MRKRCLKGFVVGLSTLVAVSGAAASPPGALEVKGALAAISAESITVGGITCQANAQTKYEKNDQHVTAAAFAVGELVELKHLDGICLELENEGPENQNGGSSGSNHGSDDQSGGSSSSNKGSKERLSAKLAPVAGGSAGGSGKVKAEKRGTKSAFEASIKIPRPTDLTGDAIVSIESGGVSCDMKVKGTRRSRRGSIRSAKIQADLKIESRTKNGAPRVKIKKGACASGPIAIVAGQEVVVKLNGSAVLSGVPALRATPTPTPTP
ncbi:MAG: hypothetical protein RL417_1592 [Pseudomonadota bacterium]|jgi:hypothetical protein